MDYNWSACVFRFLQDSFVWEYTVPKLMAALLVAGSAPGGTRRRLSFRRVERWSDPPQPEGSKSKEEETVELLLWSDIGESYLTLARPWPRIVNGEYTDGLITSKRSGSNGAATTSRLVIDGPAGQSEGAFRAGLTYTVSEVSST